MFYLGAAGIGSGSGVADGRQAVHWYYITISSAVAWRKKGILVGCALSKRWRANIRQKGLGDE